MSGLGRHALVWLSQAPEAGDGSDGALVERWHADGRPFMVCRRRSDDDEISLGFCVANEKFPEIRPRRVAARTRAADVARVARPPVLAEVARCAPALDHVASFARLADASERAGLEFRIYGSWMWQTLTGEAHVRSTSDLDLLVDVADHRHAAEVAGFLARLEPELSFRLDGELSFAGLGQVQWREFLQDRPDVVLKTMNTVRMIRREELQP